MEAFSYSVAHDLRTPLKLIYGYSDALQEDYARKLDDEGQEMLAAIKTTSVRMDKLITELLDLARLNPEALKAEPVDTQSMVEHIWRGVNPGDFELEFHSLPAVWGDPTLLSQVWQNLLENAIKFTRPCPVRRIEIGCQTVDKEQVFYVRDTGVGFDPEKKDDIFAPFKRSHSLQEFEGTGIGLAITKKIIINHKGRIWAESEPNKGSSFFFTLPMAEQEHYDQ
ncbi:MAG: ATP-binding protein [Candidatus Cloacimonetes bacterium]|nr:ATP-binding protein [Candidatus Cloacimonadota bacterium]